MPLTFKALSICQTQLLYFRTGLLQRYWGRGLKTGHFPDDFCALCFLTIRKWGAILYSEKEEKLICC